MDGRNFGFWETQPTILKGQITLMTAHRSASMGASMEAAKLHLPVSQRGF